MLITFIELEVRVGMDLGAICESIVESTPTKILQGKFHVIYHDRECMLYIFVCVYFVGYLFSCDAPCLLDELQ